MNLYINICITAGFLMAVTMLFKPSEAAFIVANLWCIAGIVLMALRRLKLEN